MHRRRFLTLVGLGAAGTTSAGFRSRAQDGATQPTPAAEADGFVPGSHGAQRIVWSVETDAAAAALTFDDGPDPAFTPRILDVLDRFGVKATFFAMGFNAARHPGLLREVAAAGHEIGSHGWRHINLVEADLETTRREILYGTELVEARAEHEVKLFRPPYGRFNDFAVRILAEHRRDMFVWSVTRGDLKWEEPARVANHVARQTGPGDIVDLHDGIGRGTFQRQRDFARRLTGRRDVEISALPGILEAAAERGLRFTTVTDLVAGANARPPT